MKEIIERKYTPLEIAGICDMAQDDPDALVLRSEQYYHHQVDWAMLHVKKNMPNYKFVLLCGPSASGKTTTAHKLEQSLINNGISASVISMDNFYKGIASYPLLPSGEPDMESVKALDIDLLNECFSQLLRTGRSLLPVFDFAKQEQRLAEYRVEIGDNDVLIMEGIHALNPEVLKDIPTQNILRIYASVRSKFVCGDEKILIPQDIRLMRRMVRDNNFRNYPPLSTLRSWENVLAGERKNINPYRDDVDLKMDTTIDYEVCVWRDMLKNQLEITDPGQYAEYPAIDRIFRGLVRFPRVDAAKIPKDSLLREFIG